MNHAELKTLVENFANIGDARCSPFFNRERTQVFAAIDEMQAEIDQLRNDSVSALAAGGVLVRLDRIDEYADVCDELVFADAMENCTWPAYELLVSEVKEPGDKS